MLSNFIKKTLSIFLFSILITTSMIFASSISEDAKKAIKQYAGYKELQKRGFNLKMLDKVESTEDLYNVLLPFMIVDGQSLDNYLTFNGYDFKRHKTIYFEDVYGTIQELLDKGYEPEQLFYYPSKGKNVYRVGKFVWENPKRVSEIWNNISFFTRPFYGKKIAYMFPGAFSQDYFKPYIKELSKKDFIVIDVRLLKNGWGGQIYQLCETLCRNNYKGHLIFITDKYTACNVEGELKNNIRASYYINGNNKKTNFEWTIVGENTSGLQNYTNNAKWNYSVGDLKFNPLPVNANEWKCCEEGEGIDPDIWAIGDDDINKTIEILTGEENFAELIKDVTEWRKFVCSSDRATNNFQLELPDCVKKIKSDEEYNKIIAKLLKSQLEYQKLISENSEKLNNTSWWFKTPDIALKTKNPQEFVDSHNKEIEAKIKWCSFIIHNNGDFRNINSYFEYPESFSKCNSYSVYADCFSKWIDKRIDWCDFCLKNQEKMKNSPTWWKEPDFFKTFETAEQYVNYFERWIDLRIWWCGIIVENQYVLKHNYIPVWYDALKENVKEWNNPENHLAELTAYLKEYASWIEYLKPHPYVIPKNMGMAKLYGAMKRTSDKIGKNCNAVPEEITKLQKVNPEEYLNKMVAYINSVSENDFEKVKLVFDIEQEILTYDNATYHQMLERINKARAGVGEDYDLYKKNLNELSEKDENKRSKQDWKTVLENGTCVCEGYARLMQYFCYKLGIKCDFICTPEDMIFAVGHAWNIVEINGEHYLLDATWGREYLFMDPEKSVKGGHFPIEPEQQLMITPMTLDEYKELKKYKGNNY